MKRGGLNASTCRDTIYVNKREDWRTNYQEADKYQLHAGALLYKEALMRSEVALSDTDGLTTEGVRGSQLRVWELFRISREMVSGVGRSLIVLANAVLFPAGRTPLAVPYTMKEERHKIERVRGFDPQICGAKTANRAYERFGLLNYPSLGACTLGETEEGVEEKTKSVCFVQETHRVSNAPEFEVEASVEMDVGNYSICSVYTVRVVGMCILSLFAMCYPGAVLRHNGQVVGCFIHAMQRFLLCCCTHPTGGRRRHVVHRHDIRFSLRSADDIHSDFWCDHAGVDELEVQLRRFRQQTEIYDQLFPKRQRLT